MASQVQKLPQRTTMKASLKERIALHRVASRAWPSSPDLVQAPKNPLQCRRVCFRVGNTDGNGIGVHAGGVAAIQERLKDCCAPPAKWVEHHVTRLRPHEVFPNKLLREHREVRTYRVERMPHRHSFRRCSRYWTTHSRTASAWSSVSIVYPSWPRLGAFAASSGRHSRW